MRRVKLFLSKIKMFLIGIYSRIVNLFVKRDNVIIFESNSDLSDNPRALFDYMISIGLNKEYQLVWLVSNRKNIDKYKDRYENVLFVPKAKFGLNKDFFRMLYYYSIASYAFYSHSFIGVPSNKKQVRFFMTHAAVPLKNVSNTYWDYRRNTDILSTSEFAAYYRCLTFDGGLERFRLLGFPRNDRLFDDSKDIKNKLGLDKYNKVYLWMPTFKHHKSKKRNDLSDNSKEDISLLTTENIVKINEKLKKSNDVLVFKFHPAQDLDFVKCVDLSNIVTISNEDLLNKEVDLYSFIGITDALITDFSSIYFDYLLTDKPICFDLCDKASYDGGIGFIMDDPISLMPGHKVYNIDDMLNFFDDVLNEKDIYKEERDILKKKVHVYDDANSSKRIVEYLGLRKEEK